MSDAVDFIFGGESTKGIRFQQDDNRRRQEFVEEQSALGRRDVLDIFPRGQETMQQGYRAAIDVATRAPVKQLQMLRDASNKSQQNILGGMNEYRRAIMGLPSEMQNNMYRNPLGMRPVQVGAGTEPGSPFFDSQKPINLGSQAQDQNELARWRNTDLPAWRSVGDSKLQNAYPEQFREPVRYDFGRNTTTGGANSGADPAALYNSALAGQQVVLPDGQVLTLPNWSNF
jgi:hypothetical protein